MADKTMSHSLHDDQEVAQDHRNPPSSPSSDDVFEFFRGGLNDNSQEKMSHAEDIIFCGKLIPIYEQPRGCRRSRSESRSDIKGTNVGALVIRNSRSVDYKKLRRNSHMSSEPVAEADCKRSVVGYGKKSSSFRWHVLLSGLVNMPPTEMNIRDLKNRQVHMTFSKTSESTDVLSVSRNVDHRKYSWRVLELLSCKCSSAAVTTSLSYMAKV